MPPGRLVRAPADVGRDTAAAITHLSPSPLSATIPPTMNPSTRVSWLKRMRRRADDRTGVIAGTTAALGTTAGAAILFAIAFLVLGGAATAYGAYAYFTQDLPLPDEVGRRTEQAFKTTKIYDRAGKTTLFEIVDPQGGDRTVVPLAQIPQHLINASIALEDQNFYTNPGFNVRGLLRAAYNNLRGRPIQGGSSITQQLVKNVIISPEERIEVSYERKMKELILAWELSRRYPGREGKDQILEWYLNTVYYGNLAYGVEAAAETYFGKHVQDLSLAEAAMLAAIPQFPAINPLAQDEADRQEAKRRQEVVLDQMYLQGYITAEDAMRAREQTLRYAPKRFEIRAPHFVMYIRQLLEERYGADLLFRGGLKVTTTIDLELQALAEEVARGHIKRLQAEARNVSNAGLIALDPRSGEILAMLGSLDFFDPEIDGQVNVTLAARQPGSSFKPFTYATALGISDFGFRISDLPSSVGEYAIRNTQYTIQHPVTAATLLWDIRTVFPDPPHPPYAPENYDRKEHGPVLLRAALANSYNIPAVKLLNQVGIANVLKTAHRMGINTLDRDYYGLSLTLGGGEVRLLDLTYAYSVFANIGRMVGQPVPVNDRQPGYRTLDPVAILRVEDSRGNVLDDYQPATEQVIDERVAYLITDILSDNAARRPAFGTYNMLELSRPAAVKTGTTNDWRDAWTIGYTPQLAVGVWVGNTDNSPMEQVPGSKGAAPIWHDFMERALAHEPILEFEKPAGLTLVEVCALSGLLPTQYCPRTRTEVFIEGTEPTRYDNMHRLVRICRPSGKLATVYCPPNQIEKRVYEVYPPDTIDWVRANNIPQPPAEYDTTYGQ
ncbi:MAG: transglycosylase domain-containing protein [Anaerolineae bacterium]